MHEALEILISAPFWVAAVRIATPFIFATLGEMLCERAGVLNLGIEGVMTVGAMSGWMAVFMGADLWTGVLVAAICGATFGILHGLLTCPLGLSQHVTGLGITLLGIGLSAFAYRLLLPTGMSSPPGIEVFPRFAIPWLSEIPIIGQGFFNQTALTYTAFMMVGLVYYVLYRTPAGLAVRMVGENPKAVEAQGLSVHWVRISAVVAGSTLMAVGGSFLTLSAFDAFYIGMMQGRGWICIALVIVAAWRPDRVLVVALLFGMIDAFQLRLQQTGIGEVVPNQIFLMLPYIASILALIIGARTKWGVAPKSLLVPYRAGE